MRNPTSRLLILSTFLCLFTDIIAQDTILNTVGFESGKPTGWVEEKVIGTSIIHWIYTSGGGWDENPKPDTAAFGTLNACFFLESPNLETTKLITTSMDLSTASKPELHFWHAQKAWTWGGIPYNDELRVYYKRGLDSAWVLLEEYENAVESWTYRVIQIPDSAFSSTFYIAFEGQTHWGHGTCIDNVELIDIEVKLRHLSSLSIKQASTGFVASGLNNNPVLKLVMEVVGNTGNVPFQSVTVKYNGTNDADIAENGVKLYYTRDTIFSTDNMIGSATSFVSGEAVFDSLNKNLVFGTNVVWITYNISDTATENHLVDGYIDIEDISIHDTLYPTTVANPSGSRTIYNTVFYDDFENGIIWELSGEFQKNIPQGLGGNLDGGIFTGGGSDPDYAFSGDTVIGVDLTGIGTWSGNYEIKISADTVPIEAISPVIDLYYYKNVYLSYQRWLNCWELDRSAAVAVSADSGDTWTEIWNSYSYGGTILDSKWKQQRHNISSLADHKKNFMVKFDMGYTFGDHSYSGWNIDDVLITGDLITDDVGVTEWLYPLSDCGIDSVLPIVKIENYGSKASPDTIPVTITFNGVSFVTDTLFGSIPKGEDTTFTFSKYACALDSAVYSSAYARTLLATDEDNTNDRLNNSFYDLPTYSIPYSRNFESGYQFWRGGGTHNTWKVATASSDIIYDPSTKAWITGNNYTTYANNTSIYAESPCYNFATAQIPIFEFKIWKALDTITGGDGVALQYSINDGDSWQLFPKHGYSWDWNWYNNPSVTALGTAGWDDITTGWITAKQVLPIAIIGESSVRFRVLLKSDTANVSDGFAFDNVKIYEAPPDVGVISIDSIKDNQCQYVNSPYIWLTVENFGLLPVASGTQMIIGLKANSQPAITDTFTLASSLPVGGRMPFHFTKPISLADTGVYTLTAYTKIEADPYFYEDYNDTAIHTFSVKPAPIPGLPHIIYSVEPDTIVLTPNYDPDYTYLWHFNGSIDSVFHVPGEGVYWYTMNNGTNGCAVTDSVVVIQLIPDLSPDSLLLPVADCELSASETIVARIINLGTDTFDVGRQVVMSYRVDEGSYVSEIAVLTDTLFPGSSFIYTFTTGADLSTLGVTYDIDIAISYPYDSVYSNDTLKDVPVISYGYPDPMLGPDRVVIDTSYTLSTDPDYVSFLWNDNPADTLNTLTFNQSGSYWVTVMDTFGCTGHDTVYIFLKVRDIELIRITNPIDTCYSGFTEHVAIMMRNTGSDTIMVDETVDVNYRINGGTLRTDTFVSGSNYLPNDSFIFVFTQNEVFTVNNHSIEANINQSGDFYPANNNYSTSYQIYGNPVVNLGDDVDGQLIAEYQLDAGAGPGYTYLWWDGSTEQVYTVTAATSGRDHFVLVTDINGCQGRDTAYIFILVNDMGVSNVFMNDEICASELKNVSIQIRNFGNLNVLPNDTILVGYEVNGYEHMEQVVLVSGMEPFQNRTYILTKIENVEEGIDTIYFAVEYDADINPPNDVMAKVVTVRESPDVDFGQTDDTLKVPVPYTLDAGAGYVSYLWQDNSTAQTCVAASSGWYTVAVSNGTCSDQFSVYVEHTVSVEVAFAGMDILIYPNPVKDQLNIEIISNNDFKQDIQIELINIQGQIVWAGKQETGENIKTINVQNYPAGIYYVKLFNKENLHMEKIVIK